MKVPVKSIFVIFLLTLGLTSAGQSLIAHYPCDNNASDISGNNNNGVMMGGVQSATDRFGNPCGALLFNGYDAYIEVPDSRTLKSPVNRFSATCWFKMQNSANYKWLTLICKGGNLTETPDNPQYRVQVFQSFNQSTISINTEFTEYDYGFNSHLFQEDEWHFYALVYDGENVKTYLDGIEIWKFPYKNNLVQNDEPLHIGKDIPGAIEYFNGCMDDIRIFNSALDAKQINRIYKDDSYASFDHDFNLTCPQNIEVNTDYGKCYATVNYDQPVLEIKCGTADLKQISGLPSGAQFPTGISTLVFEAKSNYGIQKSCYSKIIVKDSEPPVIIPVNDTTVFMDDVKLKGKYFTYPLPIASDNCSYTIKLKSGLPSGSKFFEGKNVLTFVATDNSGNQTEFFYTVHVLKREKSISAKCPEDIIKANDQGKCGAIVNFTVPDSINKSALKLTEGKTSGSFYKVGDTRNKYSNEVSNECSFVVNVYDDEKPLIKCQNDTTIIVKKGVREARVFYIKPKALDNCKIDTIIQVKGLKSGEIFPSGVTQNIFIAKDIYGNSAQCSFNITVIDSSREKMIHKEEEPVFKIANLTDSIKYYKQGVEFNKCILTLAMYDDSKQDGDTISLFFNGNEIVKKEMITIKKNGTINVALILEPNVNNYFIFKAWNEGSISPNTLRIEFYEGYFLDNMKKLKKKKPAQTIVMHAKVGVASAISLKCKN